MRGILFGGLREKDRVKISVRFFVRLAIDWVLGIVERTGMDTFKSKRKRKGRDKLKRKSGGLGLNMKG